MTELTENREAFFKEWIQEYLGIFLSDKKRQEELKATLFAYKSRLEELRQIYLNIEKELANPTVEK